MKWQALLAKLEQERAPLTLKQLAVTGKDLLALGIAPPHVSKVLQALLSHAVCNPKDNEKTRLCKLAIGFDKALSQ